MKHCSNKYCLEVNPQPLSSFTKDLRNSDGLQSQCRTCQQAGNKRWADANTEKIRAYNASPERKARHKQTTYAWRERNKDKYNAYMREVNRSRYPYDRLKRYGKTKEWYEQKMAEQNNKCKICERPPSSGKRTLAVDHNDASKVVRGVICYGCNRLLHIFDNTGKLRDMLLYLKDADPDQFTIVAAVFHSLCKDSK